MRYLITNPDSFGDILLRQPLFTGLIEAGHEVAVFVRKSYSSIIRFLDPRIRVFILEDCNPYIPSIAEMKPAVLKALDAAAEFNPDVLVIAPFQRTMIDIWAMERFAGKTTVAMKGIEVVFEEGVRLFRETVDPGDKTLFVPEGIREVEKNRRLLSLCLGHEVKEYIPQFTLDEATLEVVRWALKQLSLEEGNYIVCTPGSTSLAVKQYPPERFISILDYWAKKYKRQVLLVGNRQEKSVLGTIRRGLADKGTQATQWIGDEMNLGVLLGFISGSFMYFGNDTGPMHFAAAFGKPIIALFGGGTWPRFVPVSTQGVAILQELPCYGCGWQCIFDKAHCIHQVSVEWVKDAIDKVERKQSKKFSIDSHEFKGEVMDQWITEAREQLKSNRLRFDSMSYELDQARKIAREKEEAAAAGRKELETVRAEYLRLKSQGEEAFSKISALSEENATLRKTNFLIAEALKNEQDSSQGLEVQIAELRKSLETEREFSRDFRWLESYMKQKITESEKTMAEKDKELSECREAIEAQKVRVFNLESSSAELTQQLALARDAGTRTRTILSDFKPKLEELHLSIRQQDVTVQKFEQALQGVAQSGWTKLGVKIGIPWLSRWYKQVYDASKGGSSPVVRKEEYENPLEVKERLRVELNRVLSILDIFPA